MNHLPNFQFLYSLKNTKKKKKEKIRMPSAAGVIVGGCVNSIIVCMLIVLQVDINKFTGSALIFSSYFVIYMYLKAPHSSKIYILLSKKYLIN